MVLYKKFWILFVIMFLSSFPNIASAIQDTQDFSVWLVPAYDSQNYISLRQCIEDLSKQQGISVDDIFVPHVTLYWGKSRDKSLTNISGIIRSIASENWPVSLTIVGIGATRERFKSLFITFKNEPRLHEWSGMIKNTTGVEKTGYVLIPHLSLFYPKQGIEMPFHKKIAMMNYVIKNYAERLKWFSARQLPDQEFTDGFKILFDKIQIRREGNEDAVSTWVLVGEYKLNGQQTK